MSSGGTFTTAMTQRQPGHWKAVSAYTVLQLFQELLKWLLTSFTVPAIKRLGSLNVSIAINDLKRGEVVGDIPSRLIKGKRQRAEFCIHVLFGETMLKFQMLYVYRETVGGKEYRRKKPVGSVEIDYGDAVAS